MTNEAVCINLLPTYEAVDLIPQGKQPPATGVIFCSEIREFERIQDFWDVQTSGYVYLEQNQTRKLIPCAAHRPPHLRGEAGA